MFDRINSLDEIKGTSATIKSVSVFPSFTEEYIGLK